MKYARLILSRHLVDDSFAYISSSTKVFNRLTSLFSHNSWINSELQLYQYNHLEYERMGRIASIRRVDDIARIQQNLLRANES